MSVTNKVLILPLIFFAAFQIQSKPTKQQCADKAAQCAKKHNCSKTPDSKDCQACKTASEKCMDAAK